MSHKLLSRDEFREGVFARDRHTCVVPHCNKPAQDAHHILERRLWGNGGYFLANGASTCGEHHVACETTDLSVEQVREWCGITKPVIPDHLYDDQVYDKWGNIILPNGTRLKGELFYDESVQKILRSKLHLFVEWVKYPRTHHLPWSESVNSDDRMLPDCSHFAGKEVVVTEKMDGENTTMYRGYMHARSVDGRHHQSRDWVKNFQSGLDIPEGYRICGENLYAEHSIKYDALPTYFMGFSMWTPQNECMSWDATMEWFDLLDITPVPVLYRGVFDEKSIRALWDPSTSDRTEGYVLRTASGFPYGAFKTSMAKFVRKNHLATAKHWMFGRPIVKNGLA